MDDILTYAKQRFEKYLDQYDRNDDKIRLKIVHTYGVVSCSRKIASRSGLSPEDIELAQIIGLLHDIGRFEQVKRFHSFETETMDHASFGVQILFEEGMIREFVSDSSWDKIIEIAIARHSDYKLDFIDDERTLLHARLIRDADKLDNCRVKLEDSVETLLDVSPEELGSMEISADVMDQFHNHTSILSSTRKTKMDYWLSYIAYFFDLNFEATRDIIREEDYVNQRIDRIPYSNMETAKSMEEVRAELARENLL